MRTTRKGDRLYTRQQIEELKTIYHLVKEKGFTTYNGHKKSLMELLREDQRGKRLFIALIMMLSLAIFLHFREVRIEMLEPGMVAKNYVVAQVDFEFLDADATLVLKQEALKDIGTIFEVDEKEIKERRQNFDNYLIYHK